MTSKLFGSRGYMPPEFHSGVISFKSDIYSIGVIIMEMLTGQKGYTEIEDVLESWRARFGTSVHIPQLEHVKVCAEIGIECIETNPARRPATKHIIERLDEMERSYGFIETECRTLFMSHAKWGLTEQEKRTPRMLGTYSQSQRGQVNTLPTELSMSLMKRITSDFAPERELGSSISGTVYKGFLPEGGMIAVKKLAENIPIPPDISFGKEVTNLMSIRHENIVHLVGYCHEPRKKVVLHNGRYVIVDMVESCIAYEYLPKGNLNKYLYAETTQINWDMRFKIIKGICQGLHFLHMELDSPLIHMNLVPSSIWLDDNWVPKISDFCLSRLFGQEQTRINTMNVIGQNGYMSPEYLYRGEISIMSDIYCLGMLILEITTGEKNCANSDDRAARQFVDNVHQNWTDDQKIIDKYPSLDPDGHQHVKECIVIGLKCVEADRNKRPSIVDIVNMLNGKYVPIFY
ncbi:unnamed protein product [Urochloa humidicola]